MLSVRNMLTDNLSKEEHKQYIRPSILNISSLLCSNDNYDDVKTASYSSSFCSNYYRDSYGQTNIYLQEHHEHHCYAQPPQQQDKRSFSEHVDSCSSSSSSSSSNSSSSRNRSSSLPSLTTPYPLLDKRYCRSSRQHQIESRKIEQELLQQAAAERSQEQQTNFVPLKAKRRRASSKQLDVLNKVFERTVFPSTQLRAELGRQLGMSPRTVQIWFQNKRQALRTKERSASASPCTSSRESSASLE